MSAGFLIARLILGLALAAHGAQKLFGWFGGYGLAGTGGFFAGLGFRPGVLFALAAGLGEVGGGLLAAAGLFGPVGPALIVLVMLVAILTVHWPHGFFASSNGVDPRSAMPAKRSSPAASAAPRAASPGQRIGSGSTRSAGALPESVRS